jgi:hypothetical protein
VRRVRLTSTERAVAVALLAPITLRALLDLLVRARHARVNAKIRSLGPATHGCGVFGAHARQNGPVGAAAGMTFYPPSSGRARR